jgi:hypothetical protein
MRRYLQIETSEKLIEMSDIVLKDNEIFEIMMVSI